jgi:predicted permease
LVYKRTVDRAREVPGVLAAEVSRVGLASGRRSVGTFGDVEGYQPAPGEVVRFMSNTVGPTYFATTAMTLVRGRAFDERDVVDKPPVAIINEAAAHRYFGGVESAIGKHIGIGRPPGIEVIGVVRDAHVTSLRELPTPMVFAPILQVPAYAQALDVRVRGDAAQVGETVRRSIATAEPRLLANSRPRLIAEALEGGLSRDRLVAEIASAFGFVALALACIGLYGVLSYAVAQRTPEMGVRMAMGARPGEILRLVIAGGLRVVLVGIAVGVLVAAGVTRFIESLLFGVSPLDGVALMTGPALLLLVALVACTMPAIRASRVDPAVTLRCE